MLHSFAIQKIYKAGNQHGTQTVRNISARSHPPAASTSCKTLKYVPPPLSYQIRQLENELNVKNFSTAPAKGVTLTEAGKLLYDRSGNLLEYARSAETRGLETEEKKRILRIGLTPTTVDTIMPYVSQFSRKNPDVNFGVHDGGRHSLYQYLLDGIIDISVARTPLRLDEVSYMEVCSEADDCSISTQKYGFKRPLTLPQIHRIILQETQCGFLP